MSGRPKSAESGTSVEEVEQAVEVMRLTIGITAGLLDDPWFGEQARARIVECELELATLEVELALRADPARLGAGAA